MGQALYRKYRSKSLDEIVGQEHIITALKSALSSGRLSHAYLFTGPRGVGKTSIARILAHEINGLSYTEEDAHIDIIEIDAASNRGIDEIRDLREKVYIAPTTGKYKVYIIDEVHMLTTQAFNALLKTLEEPPEHVVFILATTEVHKLPATIISRTQRYSFRPAELKPLIAHLRNIADSEKIKVSDEALALIAEHGDGSFRDSVGLLDQLGSGRKNIDENTVHELLGIPPASAITKLVVSLKDGSMSDVAAQLSALSQQGYQAAGLAKAIGAQLRAGLLDNKPLLPAEKTFSLLKNLLKVPTAGNAEHFLELCLLESMEAPVAPPTKPRETAEPIKPAVKSETATAAAPKKQSIKKIAKQETKKKETAADSPLDEQIWPEVLAELKTRYNTLYSIVRMAQPEFLPGKLKLTFAFVFHQKRLKEAKNRAILAEIITARTGQDVEIECLFDKDAKPTAVAASASAAGAPLETVSNIFGGGELLES